MASFKEIDHLDEDTPIANQKWVCMSFLSPESIKNCKIRGLKIRGVYSSKEEADKRAQYLQKVDPDFHVFVGEVGKWLPWDPDPDTQGDSVWAEKELNSMMLEYKKNLERAKEVEAKRKDKLKSEGRNEDSTRKDKIRERLKKKLAEREKKNGGKELKTDNKELKTDNKEDLTKVQKEAKGINDRLLKIRELYDKLDEENKETQDNSKVGEEDNNEEELVLEE